MARLLIVVPSLGYGGAERMAVQLAEHWSAQHDVTLLTLTAAAQDYHQTPAAVQRLSLNLTSPSNTLRQGLSSNLRRITALRQALRTTNPNTIVALTTRVNVLCALANRGLGHRLILCERTFPPGDAQGLFWETARRTTYAWATHVCAQTETTAAWLRTHTNARSIQVLGNPAWDHIDTDSEVIPPQRLVATDQHVLLAVGRLAKEKDYPTLLAAWRKIADQHPDWHLVILGEGPMRKEIEVQLDKMATDRVHLPGVTGNLQTWYARADLFTLTSTVEGFPNSLVEALHRGCPAVATDCLTGPRELIQPGYNGYLVAPNAPGALANMLDRLMSDRNLRVRLAANAQSSVAHLQASSILPRWDALVSSEPTSSLDRQ